MSKSKWSKYDEDVKGILKTGRTDWSYMARDIFRKNNIDPTRQDVNLFRMYIKRKSNSDDIVDETMHRGNLDAQDWSVAWVKNPETGVSVLVKNTDFSKGPVVDYNLIRDEMVKELGAMSPKVKKYKRKKVKDAHCLIIDIADLHIGKLASAGGSGKEYDTGIAIERALEGTYSLLELSAPYNIDKVFFIIGNDVLHTDTPKRTTTSGTSQDTDGMWYDNFKLARMVYCSIIKKLSTIADVEVIHCPSNHDYMSGFMLADSVSCYFANDENVTFNVSNQHRKYTSYGLNMLSFSHGDGAKMEQVPYLAAHESPMIWARTKYRYAYLHHVHHKDFWKFRSGKDYVGMTVEYLRSPSESDRWHSDNGYTGAKVAIEGFIHHPKRGQVSRLTHNF